MIKELEIILYRYDLQKPPTDWDTNFLNFEYITEEHGHKNKAKLFCFTDSKEIAINLGGNASAKNIRTEFYLTSTKTKTLKLIDFSSKDNIFQMLHLLSKMNLDVLIPDFKTYENENDFGQLKSFFDAILVETDFLKIPKIVENLKVHTKSNYEDISLFGQRLTDFDNGLKFKKLVQGKYPDIDGYMWKEFNDNRGYTYCLFDSKKLTEKSTERINL